MKRTQVRYHRRRLADVAQAMRLARTQVSREQQPRAQLAQHQQRRLETVVRHAAAHSPFYRQWFDQTVPEAKFQEFREVPRGGFLESFLAREWSGRNSVERARPSCLA